MNYIELNRSNGKRLRVPISMTSAPILMESEVKTPRGTDPIVQVIMPHGPPVAVVETIDQIEALMTVALGKRAMRVAMVDGSPQDVRPKSST